MSMKDALHGVSVVNFGAGMATALTAKFMAEAGAKIVRPNTDDNEYFDPIYPAYRTWRCCESVWDRSLDDLDNLLEKADVCIVGGEDYPDRTGQPEASTLTKKYPRLVVLEITGYPKEIQEDGHYGVDILIQARTGLAYEHYSDRPLYLTYEPSNYGAALQGLIGVLAALYDREQSHRGQIVSTSLFEGALAYGNYFWSDLERPTPEATFVVPKDPDPLIFRCSCGNYVHVVLGGAGSKKRLYQALGADHANIDPLDNGLARPDTPSEIFFGDVKLLSQYASQYPRIELLQRLWNAELPAEAILKPGEAWDDPQIKLNEVIETDNAGNRFVGMPVKARWLSSELPAINRTGNSRLPLSGIRIVDLGAFVAGPYAATLLCDLGAEVIKVEAPSGDPNRVAQASFVSANRGKKSIVIDLKEEKGLQEVKALCSSADVVVSNFRTGVSSRLGIDAKSLHQLNPNLIVAENPAFGTDGPKSKNAGFDPIVQAFTGLEHRAGGADNKPLWGRTIMVDYTGGMIGAVAILMGLYHRARFGGGAEINVPLVNAGLYLGSDLVEISGKLHGFKELNARQTGRHPAECFYETADGWIAVSARDHKSIDALVKTLDIENEVDIDRSAWCAREFSAIARVIKQHDTKYALNLLKNAGIWVEECRRDIPAKWLNHPGLQERGTVWKYNHPVNGRVRRFGPLMVFSRGGPFDIKPAPELDEHGVAIRSELLGK